MKNEEIGKLRDALKLSPDNPVLRELLAAALLKHGDYENAEKAYMAFLELEPKSQTGKFGLAKAYYRLGKTSAALVLLEELIKDEDVPVEISLFYGKISAEETGNKVEEREIPKSTPKEQPPRKEKSAPISASSEEDSEGPIIEFDRPTTSFSDVGGMEKVKEEIHLKIIAPLENPQIYKAYGKAAGGGILLYGPPGCGKTYLAKATAGEARLGFISVGVSDILDMWLGSSERNLHHYFDFARKKKPCILFFDEVDALGASRTDMKIHAGRQVINQFLTELDGSKHSNEGVLIIGATNAPWHLDNAFRRPGRFDRLIFVPPPDLAARTTILNILLKDKPTGKIDVGSIAKKTVKFSGADLKAAIDMAVESRLHESIKKNTPQPIETGDILSAVKRIKPSTMEWFQSAKNYATYANESGFYNDIIPYLEKQD